MEVAELHHVGMMLFSNGKQVDQEPTRCRWMTLLMDGVMEGRNFWSDFYFALFINKDFTAQALHYVIHFLFFSKNQDFE